MALASRSKLELSRIGLALAIALLATGVVAACPTCKENLAHDPASAGLARGIYYSILFMISMPFLIFGGLSAYFYWEIRRAKARQAQESAEPNLAVQSQ
jgi:heme/copper-type cytochrome/quinol oxidase subunit 2